MKYPKAKKLRSGSWNCRVRINGQDISITRPTQKQAVAEAMAIKAGIKSEAQREPILRRSKTINQAIDDYICVRVNVLSPSTIRGYRAIQRNRFKDIMDYRIYDISAEKWQRIVNNEAQLCSPKTLKNAWRFLSAVIYETTGIRVSVRLPQVPERNSSYLTPEQILVFINALHGKTFEVPALLALSGLRRSEILALRWENIDLENQAIHISGAAVIGEDNHLEYKRTNKNRTSTRTVPIIPPLASALMEYNVLPSDGLVVTTSPNTLYSQVNRLCRSAGLPEVGVHGLRRTFASLAYHVGLSEEVAMRIGGWSNIYTMRTIYTKVSEKDIADQSARLQAFFTTSNDKNGNENDNG